jgi:hypothetical protein
MKKFTNLMGAVRGPVRVDCESPFSCSFTAKINDEIIVAVLIGDLGRALWKSMRIHDLFRVDGYVMPGSMCGYPNYRNVFAIENITMLQDAVSGGNLNAWG